MDRIASLIQDIQQAHQQADTVRLLSSVNELQALLLQHSVSGSQERKRVALLMPASLQPGEIQNVIQESEVAFEQKEQKKEEKKVLLLELDEEQTKAQSGLLFAWEDDIKELPTFAHQEGIGQKDKTNQESPVAFAEEMQLPTLNERLATSRSELADKLGAAPIKDLRKAIGLNDRFVFINELFRGDETMYDRSIKTINSFAIYAEAQYWMERELKVKLGWDNEKSITQEFYTLVRRRFA